MKQHRIRALLREPLLHFLVIGAALFFVFRQMDTPDVSADNQIVITQTDLERLADTWLRRTGRPPTAAERDQQLDHFIRTEVLSREARVLGLDKDDAIVRRRLAQKMEYLFKDLSFIAEPSDAELAAFLAENPEEFTVPATISFLHVYLDPKRRGQQVSADAETLRGELQELDDGTDFTSKGDRSLLPYDYSEQREKQLSSLFGASFAARVFALPEGSWQGPIPSKYGLHLVYVRTRNNSRVPELDAIRDRVATAWRAEKQRASQETFYQSLLQRYEIVLDETIVKTAKMGAKP